MSEKEIEKFFNEVYSLYLSSTTGYKGRYIGFERELSTPETSCIRSWYKILPGGITISKDQKTGLTHTGCSLNEINDNDGQVKHYKEKYNEHLNQLKPWYKRTATNLTNIIGWIITIILFLLGLKFN